MRKRKNEVFSLFFAQCAFRGDFPPMFKLIYTIFITFLFAEVANAEGIPSNIRQLVVGVGENWNSSGGRLQCFDRQSDGSWKPAFSRSIPVLFGKNGAAWGRGVFGQNERGNYKREGDRRTPAGLFKIGKVYGYDGSLGVNPRYPYRQVGPWDAWPDDVNNPYYNRHVVIDPKEGIPTWFEKQKMRHGDDAYRYLVEIRHNSDPPKPGNGSAIFFHTRRGPARTTFGCTTMARESLLAFMRWLRTDAQPHYLMLPRDEYIKIARSWKLPSLP